MISLFMSLVVSNIVTLDGYVIPLTIKDGLIRLEPSQPPRPTPHANLHEISAYDFLLANIHDVTPAADVPDDADVPNVMDNPDDAPDIRLINAATSHGNGTAPPPW